VRVNRKYRIKAAARPAAWGLRPCIQIDHPGHGNLATRNAGAQQHHTLHGEQLLLLLLLPGHLGARLSLSLGLGR
jgi:hypothetical protein